MTRIRKNLIIPALLVVALASGCATTSLEKRYDAAEQQRLVPMLEEAVRFPTVAGDQRAFSEQKAWLMATARRLGFEVRDAGAVTEIDLPGPAGSPVLGLVVHGDVVPADPSAWSFPPFAPSVQDGMIRGRGVADDKGPMVQALVAMKVLEESGLPRHATVRLLVGSNEETSSTDVTEYLKTHPAPALSLVLDSMFPVVVGEKGWCTLTISADPRGPTRSPAPWLVDSLEAGTATSVVPDEAKIVLGWIKGEPHWEKTIANLRARPMPEGTSADIHAEGDKLTIEVHGRAAHAGMNLDAGRNALVGLAKLVEKFVPAGPWGDLLACARIAGSDLHGSSLGLGGSEPLWGQYDVNVATIKPGANGRLVLTISIRRIPPRSARQVEARLRALVERYNRASGGDLLMGGSFDDDPLYIDPKSPAVRRLLADYERATGERAKPVVVGGGSYVKEIPSSIAFGMWFPGTPYPGHADDEQVSIASLHEGVRVLLVALDDLVSSGRPLPTLKRTDVH